MIIKNNMKSRGKKCESTNKLFTLICIAFLFVSLVLPTLFCNIASGESYQQNPVYDTYVDSLGPDTNYSSSGHIIVGHGDDIDNSHCKGFLRWDLSSIPNDSNVTSAYFQVYRLGKQYGSYGNYMNIYRVNETWTHPTWNTQPNYNDSIVWGTIYFNASSGWGPQVNLTSLVQGWVDGDFENYGICVYRNISHCYKFEDSDDPNIAPILHIEYIAPPTVMTNTSTGIEETNATLQGYLLEDGGESCTVRFEWGLNTSFGNTTSNQTISEGNTFNANISSLANGTLYMYRAIANNSNSIVYGSNETFLTKPNSMTNFTATTQSTSQINLAWTRGSGANNTYVIRKTGSYPGNRTDGTEVYNGTGTSYSDTGLSASTTYYYRAWSYTNWTYNGTTYQQWSDNYASDTATTKSSGGGYSPPSSPPPSSDDEDEEESSTTEEIENLYNITLNQSFYANDTDGDGIVDTFTDPNGILNAEHFVNMSGNASFLISVNGDLDKLFIWDTETDSITEVTHNIGTITDTEKDYENNIITVTATVEKANWIYIEVTDQYPDYTLTVKRSNDTTVPSDLVWRENNIVYVLDDPDTEYQFIYSYEKTGFLFDVILELTSASVYEGEDINALIELTNVGEPGMVNGTVNYTLSKEGEVVWPDEENVSVLGQKAFNKTISTAGLAPGEYTFEVVYSYGDNQTASAQGMFTVNAQLPSEGIPLWILIVLVVVLVIIATIVFLFKIGYLSLEEIKNKIRR